MKKAKGMSGFTLVELIVTIAVLVIVISIAVPSFTSIIRNNRIDSTARDMYTALLFARSEAVKRNVRVSVCRANSTLDACDNGEDWSGGWLVVSNNNVLKVNQPVASLQIAGPNGEITFRGNGRIGDGESFEFKVRAESCTSSLEVKSSDGIGLPGRVECTQG